MERDFEKNRSEYVQSLETQVKHLQRQLNDIQALAQWIPSVGMEMEDDVTRFTLAFNGKRISAEVPNLTLVNTQPGDITTALVDSFIKNMVADQFKPVVLPEVLRAKASAASIKGAGKW